MTSTQALATVQYRPNGIDTQQLGAILVKSGFFQDTRDAAQAIVKILAGAELGFGPIASMQGVYIVKGRVTLSANVVGAAIQRSGKYRYDVLELTNEKCALRFSREGSKDTFESTFTIEDAKQAGLISDTYRKFPRNMLFSRALTNGARWFCPEVFNGPIYTPDELGADVDEDGQVVEVQAQPPAEQQATQSAQDQVTSDTDRLWLRWLQLRDWAREREVDVPAVSLPISRAELTAIGRDVSDRMVAQKAAADEVA